MYFFFLFALQVFYIDYGTVDDVFNNEIKFLHEDFIYLPPQAIRGCLDHVKPIGGSWSRDASQAFHHIVADYSLYGKITGINTDENIFYMMLIDTSQEYDINIADMLIDRDYADIQDTPVNSCALENMFFFFLSFFKSFK